MAWKPIDIDPVNVTRSSARKSCKLLRVLSYSSTHQLQWAHNPSVRWMIWSIERSLLLHRHLSSRFSGSLNKLGSVSTASTNTRCHRLRSSQWQTQSGHPCRQLCCNTCHWAWSICYRCECGSCEQHVQRTQISALWKGRYTRRRSDTYGTNLATQRHWPRSFAGASRHRCYCGPTRRRCELPRSSDKYRIHRPMYVR